MSALGMADGRVRTRLLVCEPAGYGVHHLLNPWMDWTESVDYRNALAQWEALCDAIVGAGADVDVMPHGSRSGAMTFTRDTAVVIGDQEAIVLHNVGQRGDLEPRFVTEWLRHRGYSLDELANGDRIDGGNVVPTSDGWLIGIPAGAPLEPAQRLARLLRDRSGAVVHGVPLATMRFGHLDTALSDLSGKAWLIYPAAFDQADLGTSAWSKILADRPVIVVDADEAERLSCNVLVIGDHVIGGLSPRLCHELSRFGLEPVPVDLDEFRKAGGGAHCLTLELDPIHSPQPNQHVQTPQRRTPCPVP